MANGSYRTAMTILTVTLMSTGTADTYLHENIFLQCLPDSIKLRLVTTYPFRGRIYAYNSTNTCEVYGSGDTETQITLPLNSDCKVTQTSPDVFNAIVVIQHHPLVQKQGDRRVRLNCDYRITNQTVSSAFKTIVEHVAGASVVNSTAPSPRVRFRVLDKRGVDVMDTKLGQELFLRVDMDDNSIFALAPRSLIASSGSTSEHIELLDDLGCPMDNVIFSGLNNDGTSRFLQGRFQAFKFADDLIVRFHLNVQFCVQRCPPVRCDPRRTNSIAREQQRKRRHSHDWTAPYQSAITDPLLPLQREIIVDGATVTNLPYPASSSSTTVDNDDDDFVCLSKTWFVAILVCLILLQICIGITCVICMWVNRRKRGSIDDDDNDNGGGYEKDTDSVISTLDSTAIGPARNGSRSTFYSDGLRTRL